MSRRSRPESDWHEYDGARPLRDRRQDHRHLRQRHDEARRGHDHVTDEPATRRRGDPFAVPERRKPSEGTHLVNGVRARRRRVARAGLSRAPARPASACSASGSPTNIEARRLAVPLLLLPARGRRDAHLPHRDRAGSRRSATCSTSPRTACDPARRDEAPAARVQDGDGLGQDDGDEPLHRLVVLPRACEPDSPMATSFLVIAPNLIVFERLKVDFGDGATFRRDPLSRPSGRRTSISPCSCRTTRRR